MDERQKVSRAQERAAAKRFGAQQHKGSGSGSKRNDMHTATLLIENKTVLQGNRQITIKADDLRALVKEAALQGREPVLHIRLADHNWLLVDEDDYLEKL